MAGRRCWGERRRGRSSLGLYRRLQRPRTLQRRSVRLLPTRGSSSSATDSPQTSSSHAVSRHTTATSRHSRPFCRS